MHVRPSQSIMYIPLEVNKFRKSVLLDVQYKYLKSCSEDILRNHTFSRLLHMDVQNTIRKTQLCTQLTTENTGRADFWEITPSRASSTLMSADVWSTVPSLNLEFSEMMG